MLESSLQGPWDQVTTKEAYLFHFFTLLFSFLVISLLSSATYTTQGLPWHLFFFTDPPLFRPFLTPYNSLPSCCPLPRISFLLTVPPLGDSQQSIAGYHVKNNEKELEGIVCIEIALFLLFVNKKEWGWKERGSVDLMCVFRQRPQQKLRPWSPRLRPQTR